MYELSNEVCEIFIVAKSLIEAIEYFNHNYPKCQIKSIEYIITPVFIVI